MPKALTVCSVERDKLSGEWIVSCKDGSFTETRHFTRETAIWTGRQNAHQYRPSVLQIHREDGTMEAEYPYR